MQRFDDGTGVSGIFVCYRINAGIRDSNRLSSYLNILSDFA